MNKKLFLLILIATLTVVFAGYSDTDNTGERIANRMILLDGPAILQSPNQCALLFENTGAANNQENFALWNTGGKLNLSQFRGYNLMLTLLTIDWASGNVGIGLDPASDPDVRFQVQGRDEVMATGWASVLDGETEVTGFDSHFTEIHVGDVIRMQSQDPSVWRIVIDVQSDELLYVDAPFDENNSIINSEFYFKQPTTNISDSSNETQVFVNALGDVGINTKEPHAKLHINGTPGEDGLMFPDGTLLTSKFPAPDYDSGWFSFSSQAGVNSYKELTHDLGVYPSLVKVLIKAVDGNNAGFIFEGTGSAQNDDDGDSKTYGGVVYAYDTTRIRLWAPDANNGNSNGRIINVGDGWGGEVNSQASQTADVKVLIWK